MLYAIRKLMELKKQAFAREVVESWLPHDGDAPTIFFLARKNQDLIIYEGMAPKTKIRPLYPLRVSWARARL